MLRAWPPSCRRSLDRSKFPRLAVSAADPRTYDTFFPNWRAASRAFPLWGRKRRAHAVCNAGAMVRRGTRWSRHQSVRVSTPAQCASAQSTAAYLLSCSHILCCTRPRKRAGDAHSRVFAPRGRSRASGRETRPTTAPVIVKCPSATTRARVRVAGPRRERRHGHVSGTGASAARRATRRRLRVHHASEGGQGQKSGRRSGQAVRGVRRGERTVAAKHQLASD